MDDLDTLQHSVPFERIVVMGIKYIIEELKQIEQRIEQLERQ